MLDDVMWEMFAEMMEADGFEAWYDSEGRWEEYEERMVAAGVDADEAARFFGELAWEL